jgi:hypothetical protein
VIAERGADIEAALRRRADQIECVDRIDSVAPGGPPAAAIATVARILAECG